MGESWSTGNRGSGVSAIDDLCWSALLLLLIDPSAAGLVIGRARSVFETALGAACGLGSWPGRTVWPPGVSAGDVSRVLSAMLTQT